MTWLWPALGTGAAAESSPTATQSSRLAQVFVKLALGSPVSLLRKAACGVIRGLWRFLLLHGKRKQHAAVLLVQTLLGWLPHFAAYGRAAVEAAQLVTALLEGGSHEELKPRPALTEPTEEQGSKKGKTGKRLAFHWRHLANAEMSIPGQALLNPYWDRLPSWKSKCNQAHAWPAPC